MRRALLAAVLTGLAGCASPTGITAEQQSELASWRSAVAAKIRSKVYYPYDPAIANPQQSGAVTVRFTVNASGRIYTPQIEQSSRHPIFDAAALTIVLSSSPLPPPPAFLVERSATTSMILPVVFAPTGVR